MIIYRPHRGGLAEAMAEAKEFQTEEEIGEIFGISRQATREICVCSIQKIKNILSEMMINR